MTITSSVRWDVLDSFNTPTTLTVLVDKDSAPSITVDIDRSIRRTMDGLRISAGDDSGLDIFQNRLKPVWVEANTGDEFPLGIFMFADASQNIHTYGNDLECSLVDQTLILDQDLSETVSYNGENITVAIREQITEAGIVSSIVENTSAEVSTPTAWAAGRDTRLKVIEDLCSLAGFLPPYFDNDGTFRCRATPDYTNDPPDFVYGPGTDNDTVYADSIHESSDLLKAPNRYLVIDTGSSDKEITGSFDVPSTEPYSISQRGFVVQKTVDMQGLGTDAAAENAAVSEWLKDANTFGWMSFATAPNPRHDIFNTVEFLGKKYREQGWSLPLTAGASMEHDERAVAENA